MFTGVCGCVTMMFTAVYCCVTMMLTGVYGCVTMMFTGVYSCVTTMFTGVYGCVTMPATGYTPVHTLVDEQLMTLTLCFETCRSRGAVYAAVTGTTCLCFTSLPSHTQVPWEQCGPSRCIGNWYQPCGAPASSSGHGNLTAFVIQGKTPRVCAVSYTHLTLPTSCCV